MSKIIYRKGQKVYCLNGHEVGVISRDIRHNEMARSGDVVDGNGNSLVSADDPITKCVCVKCGALWIDIMPLGYYTERKKDDV